MRVNGRYLMRPSPIPKFDNPKMHMNPALQLFGVPNHAAAARAIDAGDAEKARVAMERVLGYTKFKISSKKAAASGPMRNRGVVIATAKAKRR